jgi:hypothetical protein
MSMQHHKSDRAVLADSWMLFCPECSQKMRLIMATPALDGKATRTYECAYGHRERITAALDGQAVRFLRSRALIDARDFTILGTICAPGCLAVGE